MIVAVIAVVFALAGTAIAAGTISVGDFTKKTKKKTVGVGKLTYVTNVQSVTHTSGIELRTVTATCPSGLHPIGGGIKLDPDDAGVWVADSYLTTTGYKGTAFNGNTDPATATVVVACAVSQAVTGAPPTS
jgi:hypothetical protein